MLSGYKFRLYPDNSQKQILLRWIGSQRLIYNAEVQEDRYYRRFERKFVAAAGIGTPIDQEYSRVITEKTAFLREVPSQVLRNGAALWRQTYSLFFKGLGGRPKIKTNAGCQAVWLTSELVEWIPVSNAETGEIVSYRLIIGTKKFPVGEIPYRAHRAHSVSASIHISVEGGKWFVSFAAEDLGITPADTNETVEAVAQELRCLTEERLLEHTLGGDRGVAKPLSTSDGRVFDLQEIQKERIEKARRQRRKWRRRAARREKGSRNQRKAYRKAARCNQYEVSARQEYAHKTSHALVANDKVYLCVFEDLKMTRRPKAKQGENGRWLKNGACAKAGLNRAILTSAWGQVVTFTRYKALRAGKLVVNVPPNYSSQECAAYGHTHSDNRPSQAEFVCLRCGHRDNADKNAAAVIARRGVQKVLSGEPLTKERKATRIFKKLGPERSEVTPGEIVSCATRRLDTERGWKTRRRAVAAVR